MTTCRRLERAEIPLIWGIDRSEVATQAYRLEQGRLVLTPLVFDLKGWPAGMPEREQGKLERCFDRGGVLLGMFEQELAAVHDGPHLVGVAVVDSDPLGPRSDRRQLCFFYLDQAFRRRGLGRRLFHEAQEAARGMGASALYISAIPTQGTVDFYWRCGAVLTSTPDPRLFELEPDDIHLVFPLTDGVSDP